MNPIRALNFDDDSSSVSGDIPTANPSVDLGVVTSLDLDGRNKLVTSLDNGRAREKRNREDKGDGQDCGCSSSSSGDHGPISFDEEEYFNSSISLEEKFEALQNYVKGLSLDEWIYQ